MSRRKPSPKSLRITGAIVIAAVLGLGVGAAKIPDLLRSPVTTWVATLPVSTGADGIAAGSLVQFGGLPQGRVILVKEGLGATEALNLIEIHFELDDKFVLAQDALIRLKVGISGTNGVIDIQNPGQRKSRFGPNEPRVIPITLEPPTGGSASLLIGTTNALLIEAIGQNADRAATRLTTNLRLTNLMGRKIADQINSFAQMSRTDLDLIQQEIKSLQTRYSTVFAREPIIEKSFESLKTSAEIEVALVRAELLALRDRFEVVESDVAMMREDVEVILLQADDMQSRIVAAGSDLQSAMNDLNSIATRFKVYAPEFSDGIARMLARLVLAGGQLKIAFDDLLPVILEAITTRPDRASTSRRLLLEAVDDTVLAGINLRDAARRLERLERLRRIGKDPGDSPVPSLEDDVTHFERMVEALAERLRQEIIDGP